MQDVVRPEIKRPEYDDWMKTARDLGYSYSGRGVWNLVRVLMAMAKSVFAELLKQKAEESLEQSVGYQAVDVGGSA